MPYHQDGRVVKALDLRSNGRMSAWVRTPLLVGFSHICGIEPTSLCHTQSIAIQGIFRWVGGFANVNEWYLLSRNHVTLTLTLIQTLTLTLMIQSIIYHMLQLFINVYLPICTSIPTHLSYSMLVHKVSGSKPLSLRAGFEPARGNPI